MADERFGIDAREFFFTDGECDDRDIFGGDFLIAEFFVEGNVGVAVDGGDDGGFLTGRAEFLDGGYTGLPIGVAERSVIDGDIFVLDAFGEEISFEDFVGGARIDVICPSKTQRLTPTSFMR